MVTETRRAEVLPWITTAARIVLAAILFWAGWAKVTEPPALQKQAVEAYQLLPASLTGLVGYGLPVLEIVLAVLLLVGFATRFVAIISAVLMAVFIGGIASAWARGLSIDCGCFGGGGAVAKGQTKYLSEIIRDVVFLALAVWIARFPRSRASVDGLLGI
ncbi:DoxX family protein [Actinocorallia longicatena]|uniref:DoxX family membrane protein n=1 Tax=Actinocorallia longicatena TaxID=111803 RepID=A0ABP6QQ28_9ACTN